VSPQSIAVNINGIKRYKSVLTFSFSVSTHIYLPLHLPPSWIRPNQRSCSKVINFCLIQFIACRYNNNVYVSLLCKYTSDAPNPQRRGVTCTRIICKYTSDAPNPQRRGVTCTRIILSLVLITRCIHVYLPNENQTIR